MREKRRKNVLLAVLVLAIVAGLLTPAILAAPKADDSSGKQATVFDPFAMQTVSLAGDNATVPVELKLTRQTIRIPFRPGLRSAFRPTW